MTEAGSKNPHANVTVEWDVAGDVAYDVDYFEIRNADGQRFDVVTTVTDTAGNQDTTSKTVQE